MTLTQVTSIDEVVKFFSANPHDRQPAPADVVELVASTKPVEPNNTLYWDVWRTDYANNTTRYPFISGQAQLMLSRQIKIGNDPFSATLIFPFDLTVTIAKVVIDQQKDEMTIWVYKSARYWQYIRSLGRSVARVFEDFRPDSLTIGIQLLAQMDSQTPSHTETAAAQPD
ncbi:hypothetical protein [Fibrella aestuarina]|nr:hypothetical protein [Fibrella aestuarina]